MQFVPPKYVKSVLKGLETAGFKAFLVGGCVRDMFLEKRPQDWDICTDALPQEVLDIFPGSLGTGLKHGTVTVLVGKRRVEVTTFRTESGYSDHRHPQEVRFISDLAGDLERRDFTINAIAVPLNGIVMDPFGGREDIANKLIRCVGDPELRFEEDALRMLRALRFSARLGFDIEKNTANAIYAKAGLVSALAPERVHDELEKILVSPRPAILGRVLSYHLLDSYIRWPGATADFRRLRYLPKNKRQRWTAFCAKLEKMRIISSTEEFLRSLRLDNTTIRCCVRGVAIAMGPPPADRLGWKRVLAAHGVDTASCAAAACDMLCPGACVKELKSILKSGDCFSLKRLAVNGDDLAALGLSGSEIGAVLKSLLAHVLEFPGDNTKERLINLIIFSEKR